MNIDEQTFALICFLTLVADRGFKHTHPNHIEEMADVLGEGWKAADYLDDDGKEYVLDYLDLWDYDVPEVLQEYTQQV